MSFITKAFSAAALLAVAATLTLLPSAAQASTALTFNCNSSYAGGTYYVIPGQTLDLSSTSPCVVKVNNVGTTASASVTYAAVLAYYNANSQAATVIDITNSGTSVINLNLVPSGANLTNVAGQYLGLTKTAAITQSPSWFASDAAIAANGIGGKPECKMNSGTHPYTTLNIKVSASGAFTFRVISTSPATTQNARSLTLTTATPANPFSNPVKDNFLAVYTSFDPTNLNSGIVGCNDDSYDSLGYRNGDYLDSGEIINDRWAAFASSLQPGNYTLVLSTFSDYLQGNWATNSYGVNQAAVFQMWGPQGAIADESATPTPTQDPALAVTGVDPQLAMGSGIAGSALLLLGIGAIVLAFRRRSSSK